MAIIKCKMCGGNMQVAVGSYLATCEYCGTVQTIPDVDNEKKLRLFNRANSARLGCEFDKAENIYENIVIEFPEEAEAYWGLILCHYGIEYVDDKNTGKKIPTCHRSTFESLLDDENYAKVLENADILARRVYQEEANYIENLRIKIIEISSKEKPYDIFICYKQDDARGNRTIDSVLAQDIYDALIKKGYKVFFAHITLEDKVGKEFEPYIFAALNSARIMLAIGTSYDYYNAVWVKNEWSRFLHLIKGGKKKTLIPCYKDINKDDIPKEFLGLPGQDMGKVGAMQDLLHGIEIILGERRNESATQSLISSHVKGCWELGFQQLELGDKNQAMNLFQEAAKIDSSYSISYLGMLVTAETEQKADYYETYVSLYNVQDEEVEDKYIKQAKKSIYDFLISFIECKDSGRVKKCLTNAVDIEKEIDNMTLLCHAVKSGELKIVEEIIHADADINLLCNHGKTGAVLIACESKNASILECLLKNGGNANVRFEYEYKYTDRYGKECIEKDWKIPIATCIEENFLEGIELLLKYGESANAIYGNNQWTVISYALYIANKEACNLLIQYGANINALASGMPSFIWAFSGGNDSMVEYAKTQNAEFDITWEQNGETYDVVRWCLDKGTINKIALIKSDEKMKKSIQRNMGRLDEWYKKCNAIQTSLVIIFTIAYLVLVIGMTFYSSEDAWVSSGAFVGAFIAGPLFGFGITSFLELDPISRADNIYGINYNKIVADRNNIHKLIF